MVTSNPQSKKEVIHLKKLVKRLKSIIASGNDQMESAKRYIAEVADDYECLIEAVNNMGAAAILETDIEGMAYYIIPADKVDAVLFHFSPRSEEIEA